MITATPITCHQTDMLLIIARRLVRKMLMIAVAIRMIAKRRKVSARMCSASPKLTPKTSTP